MNDRPISSPRTSTRPDEDAELASAEASEDDPVLPLFLDFLERDIAANPEHLRAVDLRLVAHINSLVGTIEMTSMRHYQQMMNETKRAC